MLYDDIRLCSGVFVLFLINTTLIIGVYMALLYNYTLISSSKYILILIKSFPRRITFSVS